MQFIKEQYKYILLPLVIGLTLIFILISVLPAMDTKHYVVESEIKSSEEVERYPLLSIPTIEFSHYKIETEDIQLYEKNQIVSLYRYDPTAEPKWLKSLKAEQNKAEEEISKNKTEDPVPSNNNSNQNPLPANNTNNTTPTKQPKSEVAMISFLDMHTLAKKYSEIYNIPYLWILAKVWTESGFNIYAENFNRDENGTIISVDRGLMQINSSTAPMIAKKLNIPYEEGMEFDPDTNVRMGAYYLSYLKETLKTDDLHQIFTSYQRGIQGAKDYFNTYKTYETEHSRKVVDRITELSQSGDK